jgi:hypothetical protein
MPELQGTKARRIINKTRISLKFSLIVLSPFLFVHLSSHVELC